MTDRTVERTATRDQAKGRQWNRSVDGFRRKLILRVLLDGLHDELLRAACRVDGDHRSNRNFTEPIENAWAELLGIDAPRTLPLSSGDVDGVFGHRDQTTARDGSTVSSQERPLAELRGWSGLEMSGRRQGTVGVRAAPQERGGCDRPGSVG